MIRSSDWRLTCSFSDQNIVCITYRSHACCMPSLSHFPRFDHPSNIWWTVRVMKLLTEIFFSLSPRSPSWVHISSPAPCSEILWNLFSTHNVRDQVSHPYKISGKIIGSYVLIVMFLERKWEQTRSARNGSRHSQHLVWSWFLPNFATFVTDLSAVSKLWFCPPFWWRFPVLNQKPRHEDVWGGWRYNSTH
jgi:hypothetical protein